MSWILGEVVKGNNIFTDLSKVCNCKNNFSFSNQNVKIIAGGKSRNLFLFPFKNKQIFVAGIGIDTSNGKTKIRDKAGWEKILRHGIEEALSSDGHFIILVVEKNDIKIYTDRLGLRDIYICEFSDRIIFSTKIKWITYFGKLELNYQEFSSRWLMFNQISQESVFKNYNRLVAGKSVRIILKNIFEVIYSRNDFNFNNDSFTNREFSSSLASLLNINLTPTENLSLSLSGGMDSRVIFSLLLKNRKDFFETHSFGNPKHPDSLIAKQLTDRLNITHHQYHSINYDTSDLISEIENYTTETIVNNAASAVLQLKNYDFLADRNVVIVDGGFGEIWRREFFYKLIIQGRKALLEGDIDKIIPYLSLPRADIFSDEILTEMKKGIRIQLENIFSSSPKLNKNNVENWIDHFALKTRLTNYYSHEQTRLDEKVTAVMPFVQQSLIKNLFCVKIKEKKNGKLFRKIIKQNYPELREFSLVKGTTQHPYVFNSLQSRIWSILMKKMGKGFNHVSNEDILLKLLKEYLFDSINSKNISESSVLDINKIKKLVDDYYNGKFENGYSLDWLLSFIIFNQSISK